MSLFEKPQIGPAILDHILYDVFRSLYLTCLTQQKHKNCTIRCVSFNGDLTSLKTSENYGVTKQFMMKECQELIKNANLLFNTLQSYYIWVFIERSFEKAVENIDKTTRNRFCVNDIGFGEPTLLEICILTELLLDIIPVETYSENVADILPNLFKKLMNIIEKHVIKLNDQEITASLNMCAKILMKIQPVVMVKQSSTKMESDLSQNSDILKETTDGSNSITNESQDGDGKDMKQGLEKSKSDSRLNENLNRSELIVEDNTRERSNSNQMGKRKDKVSPKIEKKSKNKKSKSSSKLYDLKKEESDSVIEEVEVPQVGITVTVEPEVRKIENRQVIYCLEAYKRFLVVFLQSKIIPHVDIDNFFKILTYDKDVRIKQLEALLKKCLVSYSSLTRKDFNFDKENVDFRIENVSISCEYENSLSIACNILLDFSAFPNLLTESSDMEKVFPYWLKTLIVCACCTETSKGVVLITVSALLEIFSLAKSQNFEKSEDGNFNVIIAGILENLHVNFIEENTIIIKVSYFIQISILCFLCSQ